MIKSHIGGDIFALCLSIGIHSLLLLSTYTLHIGSTRTTSATGYTIALSTQSPPTSLHKVPRAEEAPPTSPSLEASATSASPVPLPQHTRACSEQADTIQTGAAQPDTGEAAATTEEQGPSTVIDERGLYTPCPDPATGAVLELPGWIWDQVPEPIDHTQETGKLIFEISVDDLGEVIAVKTLEKTVSPLAEQIYREALARLTFSKTSENNSATAVSKGKVTFLIRDK
ncbi:MAG: hypothetical protein AAFU83_00965 [Bacteroidota bacterium]